MLTELNNLQTGWLEPIHLPISHPFNQAPTDLSERKAALVGRKDSSGEREGEFGVLARREPCQFSKQHWHTNHPVGV